MNNITIISAIGKNRELGKKNQLLWHIKEDLEFFKNQTTNKKIIMGINTFNSLPKLLPNRTHIVLTRKNISLGENITIYHDINDLLNYISKLKEEVMVIGGGQIYKEFINYANKMLLTHIDASYDADTYFPEFNKSNWNIESLGEFKTEDLNYKRLKYTRK